MLEFNGLFSPTGLSLQIFVFLPQGYTFSHRYGRVICKVGMLNEGKFKKKSYLYIILGTQAIIGIILQTSSV
jgi:hypothetical protein